MTVILANGDFPRPGTEARAILERAERVVCCDGAADAYRDATGKECDLVVGDMDSIASLPSSAIVIREQETNDLEKAVRVCREQGYEDLIILGATGKREDHAIGNIFRALELGVDIVTDTGRFHVVRKEAKFAAGTGRAVSIFAPTPGTRCSSTGLVWPLDGVPLKNLYCATLNRTCEDEFSISATEPVLVFF